MEATGEIAGWSNELGEAASLIGPRFSRSEVRARAAQYLAGLISRVERKNGWQLAEELGERTPANLQHFIARATWDADLVRDDLTNDVANRLADPDGVLIIDETGFLKKGTKSVGVKRQYSGTAGRIENCQIGVFLAYRGTRGHVLVDRELYLPKEWAEDAGRRKAAKVPPEIEFATKPELARRMLVRALNAGLAARWVTADAVYGSDYKFRSFCENRRLGYVVAITSNTPLAIGLDRQGVGAHVDSIPARSWKRLSCGAGSKGERFYDWTIRRWPYYDDDGYERGWLVRRSADGDLTHYFTFARKRTPLHKLVTIAGSRWAVEECFEQAKQLTGLDEYEVRSWDGWRRHVTLSMLAHATLAVVRAAAISPDAIAPTGRRNVSKKR